MAVDGAGRLEWLKKFLVWITRLGVSFHVLPESRRAVGCGDTRERAARLHLSAASSSPPRTFTATIRHYPLPTNASGHCTTPDCPSVARTIDGADMCIGDAYGAAHVVD